MRAVTGTRRTAASVSRSAEAAISAAQSLDIEVVNLVFAKPEIGAFAITSSPHDMSVIG